MKSKNIKNKGEKQYAEFLESRNIKYKYQYPIIYLTEKLKAVPDFYLIDYDVIVEIVANKQSFHQRKYKFGLMGSQNYKLIVLMPNAEPYSIKGLITGYNIFNIKLPLLDTYYKPIKNQINLNYKPIPKYDWDKLIKQYRKKHNLTQKKFGEKIGATWQTVCKWENKKQKPSFMAQKLITELKEKINGYSRN